VTTEEHQAILNLIEQADKHCVLPTALNQYNDYIDSGKPIIESTELTLASFLNTRVEQ
jgi:hypothetical protein